MQVDHVIIGQGISGTLLSRSLQQEGRTVLVIDRGAAATSSKVASGVINPVTGKRLVRTWLIDELMPAAWNTYKAMEAELGVALVQECSILDMHSSYESRDLFEEKLSIEHKYLHTGDSDKWQAYFRFNYGIGEVAPCILIALNTLVDAWSDHLLAAGALLREVFEWQYCSTAADHVLYKDIKAGSIIFCDGSAGADNPYFGLLPWSKDKGEALIVSIPGLPQGHIYKQGISIVPWKDDLFWVGATHDWKFTDMLPTPGYRKKVEEQLGYWLRLPYKVVDHLVAQRPVNVERKPFVGMHPTHSRVGIFNGMGTKGCSVAPYFAAQFAQHLAHSAPLMADVDVKRFAKILSRGVV